MLGKTIGELTHIQHRNLFTFPSTIHAESQVAQLTICQPDECMARGADVGCLSHLHSEVFQFWQTGIPSALRLEDILTPQAYDGKFGWLVFAATVHVERHLGLYASHRHAGTDDLASKFRHVVTRVR